MLGFPGTFRLNATVPIEAMRYVLDRFDYDDKDRQVVGTPDPRIVGSPDEVYDEDQLTDQPQNSS